MFDLTGLLLDDVASAFHQSGTNPYLEDLHSLDKLLHLEIPVRGIMYNNLKNVALGAKVGYSVDIIRDYDNLIDRNAILILLGGRELGYIPKDIAQLIAPDLDSGKTVHATIKSVVPGRVPNVTITLSF